MMLVMATLAPLLALALAGVALAEPACALMAEGACAADEDAAGLLSVSIQELRASSHLGMASHCPGSEAACQGNQCCPPTELSDNHTYPCPSAEVGFAGCEWTAADVTTHGEYVLCMLKMPAACAGCSEEACSSCTWDHKIECCGKKLCYGESGQGLARCKLTIAGECCAEEHIPVGYGRCEMPGLPTHADCIKEVEVSCQDAPSVCRWEGKIGCCQEQTCAGCSGDECAACLAKCCQREEVPLENCKPHTGISRVVTQRELRSAGR